MARKVVFYVRRREKERKQGSITLRWLRRTKRVSVKPASFERQKCLVITMQGGDIREKRGGDFTIRLPCFQRFFGTQGLELIGKGVSK